MSSRQLTKSANNRWISGVIAGICEYFGWGPDVVTILRILYVVLAFSSMGGLIFLYFIASWIIPSAPRGRNDYNERDDRYRERYNNYQNRWEDKMNRKAQKWEDKARKYEDKWTSGSWNNTWENPTDTGRKMKNAEPVEHEKEDDWSDF